ncbi:MAG: hypothetical protein H6584_04705 [Flavobacteriales bacterium]|nr:hypothetical protein [Flavobacteriales bacterium]
MLKKLSILFLSSLAFISCDLLPYKDVNCRPFVLKGEMQWFPEQTGETVRFTNTSNQTKDFTVVDKFIAHRTSYVSDTGCGCRDLSGMLLTTSDKGSIWFNDRNNYIYDKPDKIQENVFIVINDVQSGFYEIHKTKLDQHTINDVIINDVERFDFAYTDDTKVKRLYRAKSIGVIQFELVNGEVWTNEKLVPTKTQELSSFKYSEDTCN